MKYKTAQNVSICMAQWRHSGSGYTKPWPPPLANYVLYAILFIIIQCLITIDYYANYRNGSLTVENWDVVVTTSHWAPYEIWSLWANSVNLSASMRYCKRNHFELYAARSLWSWLMFTALRGLSCGDVHLCNQGFRTFKPFHFTAKFYIFWQDWM